MANKAVEEAAESSLAALNTHTILGIYIYMKYLTKMPRTNFGKSSRDTIKGIKRLDELNREKQKEDG